MTEIQYEDPCAHDGKPCTWMSEEFYDADGEIDMWDLFCTKCGNYRNWSKEELPETT